MEEQLISFKTAKLAKKKGFDIDCNFNWVIPIARLFKNNKTSYEEREETIISVESLGMTYLGVSYKNYTNAPTQSLLQKWLREKNFIEVFTNPNTEFYNRRVYSSYIIKADNKYYRHNLHPNIIWRCDADTYEETLEIGLQEALKLI